MKDLGTLKYFLGIDIARKSSVIFLCQRKYTLDISMAGLLGAKPVFAPIQFNYNLAKSIDSFFFLLYQIDTCVWLGNLFI